MPNKRQLEARKRTASLKSRLNEEETPILHPKRARKSISRDQLSQPEVDLTDIALDVIGASVPLAVKKGIPSTPFMVSQSLFFDSKQLFRGSNMVNLREFDFVEFNRDEARIVGDYSVK